MFVALAGLTATCGKDDKEEEKTPLPTAFLELNTATDANLIFNGEAGEVTVSLNVNREVEATASADWVTPTVTAGAGSTATLKITVAQSNAAKRRTATVTLATKLAEEGDKAATPLTIALEQGVYGLPEADLLNLVFDITGGPGGARDISPLENTVLDMTTSMNADGTENCPKVYPTVALNSTYGRNAATFTGPNTSCHGNRGSCAYRVNLVDYSQWATHYFPLDPPSYDGVMAGNTQIPFTAFGEGLNGSFSAEVIFRLAPERPNGAATLFSWSQSFGASLGISNDQDQLGWYLDTGPTAICDACSDPLNLPYKAPGETGEFTPLTRGVYYHAVVTYDRPGGKMAIFLDGAKSNERSLQPGYVLRNAQPYKSDALAQYVAIGGDAFRTDPPVSPPAHINDSWNNWAEYIFSGEIVLLRMYGKVLTDAEVKTLYDYEKP
jgi:hypothetical protein